MDWISVGDRLPVGENREVLVWVSGDKPGYCLGNLDGDMCRLQVGGGISAVRIDSGFVTHWAEVSPPDSKPSHRDRLITLLDDMGFKRVEKYADVRYTTGSLYYADPDAITVGQGDGYDGFYVEFKFDSGGKFLGYWVGE